jgi:hypothetical protein
MPFSRSSPSLSATGDNGDVDDDEESIDTYSFSSSTSTESSSSPTQYEPCVSKNIIIGRPIKTVRLLIPSSTQQDDPLVSERYNIVMPQDYVPETPKLGSGSRWTATQLDLLNVNYDPTVHYVFHFENIELPSLLSQCTCLF